MEIAERILKAVWKAFIWIIWGSLRLISVVAGELASIVKK